MNHTMINCKARGRLQELAVVDTFPCSRSATPPINALTTELPKKRQAVARPFIGGYECWMSDQVIVEIRAAEGGEDAKCLVKLQLEAYTKAALRRRL